MIIIIQFIFNVSNFSIVVCFFLTKLLMSVLFSTVVNAVFVAKLLILGILFSTTVKSDFLAISDVLGILFSIVIKKLLVFYFQQHLIEL